MNAVFIIFGVLGFWCSVAIGNPLTDAEYKLINNVLLKNYSKQVLPLVDKKPVIVTFNLIFRKLVGVDEKNQFLTLHLGVNQYWNNPLLRWDPNKHMGIETVNLHNDLVWVPDICLYNTIEDSGVMAAKIDTSVTIDYTGHTTWLSPFQFKIQCKINVAFFPFDEQVCNLTFGSWTYHGNYIDIVMKTNKLNFTQYVENTQWQLVEVSVEKNVEYYPDPYPTLTYRVVLKRKMLFYMMNLIIPCVIIAILAFLSFGLPVECGERIALVITVLLSMTVFMLLTFNFMPPTSEMIPLVGKFYLACTVEITVCLIATFLIVKWHYNDTPVPTWIKVLINNYLAKFLYVVRPNCLCYQPGYHTQYPGIPSTPRDCYGKLQDTVISPDEGIEIPNFQPEKMGSKRERENKLFARSIRSGLAIMADKIRRDEVRKITRSQWRLAARVLDRFMFLVFLFLFFITVGIIFVSAIELDKNTAKNTVSSSK